MTASKMASRMPTPIIDLGPIRYMTKRAPIKTKVVGLKRFGII